MATSYIPRRQFDMLFGILMIAASAYLIWSASDNKEEKPVTHDTSRRFKVNIV